MTLVAIAPLCGCAGDNRVPIAGAVTLDGNRIDKGTIQFKPADGLGPSAEAKIEQGQYEVLVAPGQKHVFISGLRQTGVAYPSGPEGPAIPMYDEILPPHYLEPGAVQCTIEESDQGRNFDLSGKP